MSSPDLILLPDAEQLVSAFLRSDVDVLAELGSADKVFTEFPRKSPLKVPFVKLTLIGGPEIMYRPRWLRGARIQVDVWARPKTRAKAIAELLAAVMAQRMVGAHDLGVVTGVDCDEPSYLPDSDLSDPATPRYLFQVVATIHP